ncbi:MAG: sulfite exporter TauE/SafE family protein [Pseudomonadota bacterium]
MTLDVSTLLIVFAGAACGGFVNGLAGFGTALFALGWWLQVMPPATAVPVVLAMSVIAGLQGVIVVRGAIHWPRLLRFLIPALLTVPLGVALLPHVDARPLKLVIAAFLVLYGAFFAFRRDLPEITRPTHAIDVAIGAASGFIGALAGLSGALPTMWASMRTWGKAERRALLQPFNVVILAVSFLGVAVTGGVTREVLITIAVALPVTLLSAQVGLLAFARLTDDQFRRLLILLMLVSGLVLAVRELV